MEAGLAALARTGTCGRASSQSAATIFLRKLVPMLRHRAGVLKVILVVALAVIVGASTLFMVQEQKARSQAEQANASLIRAIDQAQVDNQATPTPKEVHELIGRQPNLTRVPARHRYVEEYYWKGPMGEQRLYVYFSTAADKFLEAVSLNHKLDQWEGGDP